MSLTQYKRKRSAGKTPEPFGGKPEGKELRFVVQKHDASHLHYDFRLEIRGVLVSWAVPKGPSMDPKVKRLAVAVEDHPYDYRNFEGIIPEEEYGGGTVIVWDEGTYFPADPVEGDLAAQQTHLKHQWHLGKIRIVLKGKKLKGEFALVKSRRGDNQWLLMKINDKYATTDDILLKDRSVISRKTVEQMAKAPSAIYGANKKPEKKRTPAKKKADPKATPVRAKPAKNVQGLLKKARKGPFFTTLKPMLATLVDDPFDRPGWLYEIKWDGYRAVAFRNKSRLDLKSRNDKDFGEKFYPVYEALKQWKVDAVLDGEIVVVDRTGRANFGDLQNWRSEADGTLRYYVFDILWYKGYDLRHLPLQDRKAILKQLVPEDSDTIFYSNDFETSGIEFLEAARQMDLEGIIAKRCDSPYRAGDRTADWLKIKASKRQEVVIGGYTRNEGTKKPFSALLLGVYKNGKLIYTGKTGTGWNIRQQKQMLEQFRPLETDKVPFPEEPDYNKPSRFRPDPPKATVTWLKPSLVCEVSYAEITSDGVMRHASFVGMREDKKPKEIVLEREADTDAVVDRPGNAFLTPAEGGSRKTLLNPKDASQVRKAGGHELSFTNLHKIFWPKERVTKRDLINYYYQVAEYILPYLKDRPQSLNRFPNGIDGKSFYQKDVTGKVPGWMKTYGYYSDTDRQQKNYLLCNDEATLLYMANLACIEIHPWNSTVRKPDHPTWCLIDIDPDKQSFNQVIEAARVTKEVLDGMGVDAYCKTSGSTGLHIYIPLGNKYTYDQCQEFARVVVTLVQQQLPSFTTLERIVRNRKGKMYLDFLQNRPHATLAAPYSLRPKPGATVSMPLHWEEVKPGLKMSDFTIFNALERLKSEGDIFKPVLGKGIDLRKIIREFSAT